MITVESVTSTAMKPSNISAFSMELLRILSAQVAVVSANRPEKGRKTLEALQAHTAPVPAAKLATSASPSALLMKVRGDTEDLEKAKAAYDKVVTDCKAKAGTDFTKKEDAEKKTAAEAACDKAKTAADATVETCMKDKKTDKEKIPCYQEATKSATKSSANGGSISITVLAALLLARIMQ